MTEEKQYIDLVKETIDSGYEQSDRTGVGAFSKIGVQMRFNLRNNTIPLYTTRRTFFRGAVEEILWMIRGETDAKLLQNKNIHIWDGNTSCEFIEKRGLKNELPEGSIGTLYGFQFRNWNGDWQQWRDGRVRTGVDQLAKVINLLKADPSSRRMLISNYNVSQADTGVLEPCHVLYSFNVDISKKELHSVLWMRSVDLLCGQPLNIIHISLLTHILAKMFGYTAGDCTFQAANSHVYKNHVNDAKEQMTRIPFEFPKFFINKEIKSISDIETLKFEDFELRGYQHHPPIKYEMAV